MKLSRRFKTRESQIAHRLSWSGSRRDKTCCCYKDDGHESFTRKKGNWLPTVEQLRRTEQRSCEYLCIKTSKQMLKIIRSIVSGTIYDSANQSLVLSIII